MDNLETAETAATRVFEGNTKQKPARSYIYTWNNYNEEEIKYLEEWSKKNCLEYVFQEEKGENGTPHLQGYFYFKSTRHFNALKKVFPKMHIEKARSKEACINYCMKTDTRIGPIRTNLRMVNDPIIGLTLKKWQSDLLTLIETEPDTRTINWYHDAKGGSGKTTIAKHLCIKYPKEILYVSGKCSDIKYGIHTFLKDRKKILRVVIFDFVRSSESFISYEGIEAVKNGIFYNTKYESGMTIFNSPHVIIFANFEPNKEKLSLDRWHIVNLSSH